MAGEWGVCEVFDGRVNNKGIADLLGRRNTEKNQLASMYALLLLSRFNYHHYFLVTQSHLIKNLPKKANDVNCGSFN